ncbi:DUF2478 domain-containing protein [Rhodobacteraceae bacterium 2CG4]|uniref:DUF2478 domain-containing protein n=1 Tax=Halovulum marinum TaxID=2662447 RepID=A0A6L5YVI7_9RHOB|nr:DUF2478 domain-containing protein [Halovulum marinum]MSU88363.1 DUF2478 domain-containing protein [Halovulum marinum]
MKLACTMAPGRGDTDLLLERLATELGGRGLGCCGVVQINSERADAGPCDMDVRVLPDGPVLRISQDLGPQARGCRLDPAALETAAGLVATSLLSGADLLIINKFGKHEAEGRGFRNVIAKAVAMNVPVLVGLNELNRDAFEAFAGDMPVRLSSDIEVLMEWASSVTVLAA